MAKKIKFKKTSKAKVQKIVDPNSITGDEGLDGTGQPIGTPVPIKLPPNQNP